MKTIKLLTISILSLISSLTFAQNPEYVKAMEEVVTKVQNAQWGEDLQPYANQFERIASAEPKEWLPNYWAAYCYMTISYTEKDADKKDILLEKAEKLVATADQLMPNNDEVEVMKADIASARMSVDPQNRWQKYGALVKKSLGKAAQLNPENPRAKLLEAQGIFYTPEAFGGGKKKAIPLIQNSLEKFAKFKPTSSIMPNWGEAIAKYTLGEAEK